VYNEMRYWGSQESSAMVIRIDPILIFLFILFLGWLWGMAGIFMAVPLLMIIKIVFDQTQARETV